MPSGIEPRIFRELLISIGPGPFIVIEHDDASRNYSLKERFKSSKLSGSLVQVYVQIRDGPG
jgi:hypothetical protein